MTYKQTLFFIGQSLTINYEEHNKNLIKEQLESKTVDWESVVKVSTAHFVFPALYCNLKKANFLQYLPSDLVEYMKHITDLNRERNQQIITQAKEINELLIENNITPIFLKGTGNLLEGLYDDIAERMVGDIDLIVRKNKTQETYKLLKKNKYYSKIKGAYIEGRHLKRLIRDDRIAAIEIHKEMISNQNISEFNLNLIIKDLIIKNNQHFLGYADQLNLSIIAKQINDNGYYFKDISLRNAYDVFLLSKKTSTKNAFNYLDELKNPLTCFLASCYVVFNQPKSLEYISTEKVKKYIKTFNKHLNNPSLKNKHFKKTKRKLFFKSRLNIVYKSIFSKEYRSWVIIRVTNIKWHKEKLVKHMKNLNKTLNFLKI